MKHFVETLDPKRSDQDVGERDKGTKKAKSTLKNKMSDSNEDESRKFIRKGVAALLLIDFWDEFSHLKTTRCPKKKFSSLNTSRETTIALF